MHSSLRQAWLAQVEGNLIKWQRWHIRIGFTWREGLVIYNVAYEDEGRLRPILNRASIAEMAVPYGEPQVEHSHLYIMIPPSACQVYNLLAGIFHTSQRAGILAAGAPSTGGWRLT